LILVLLQGVEISKHRYTFENKSKLILNDSFDIDANSHQRNNSNFEALFCTLRQLEQDSMNSSAVMISSITDVRN